MRFNESPILRILLGAILSLGLSSVSAAEDPVPDLAGIYELDGQTLIGETQARFIVTGKLVIRQEGNQLSTFVEGRVQRSAGENGPAAFALVAHGEATVNGTELKGGTNVQTIMSEVQELDVSAPYIPKKAGPSFHASSTGKILGEGELQFTMKSDTDVFGPGADRVTTLHAVRVARKATELKKK